MEQSHRLSIPRAVEPFMRPQPLERRLVSGSCCRLWPQYNRVLLAVTAVHRVLQQALLVARQEGGCHRHRGSWELLQGMKQ